MLGTYDSNANPAHLEASSSSTASLKKYKSLTYAEKISCLIVDEELQAIEANYQEMLAMPPNHSELSQEQIEKF